MFVKAVGFTLVFLHLSYFVKNLGKGWSSAIGKPCVGATMRAEGQPGAPTAPRDSNCGAWHGFVGQRILKKGFTSDYQNDIIRNEVRISMAELYSQRGV